MRKIGGVLGLQQSGLVLLILALGAVMTAFAGKHLDRLSGQVVNNFLNPSTLLQVANDTSLFAIMAVGATAVIVSGGIDLSVGSIYAMSGVLMAMAFRDQPAASPWLGLLLSVGIGLALGLVNGVMVASLGVHPFIVTLGTMLVYRGIAVVASGAESVPVPVRFMSFGKANLGLRSDLYPVPTLAMIMVVALGGVYLSRTTWGRRVFAVGGNLLAARYSGLRIGRILVGVYALSGLTAGIAAFLGSSYYGAASSADADGYELYVIAAAVVGGASLAGGRGTALGAGLGALLIVMIRQSIRTLRMDQNYEWIIIGVAIVLAVVLDRWNSRLAERRAMRARAA